MTTLPSYLDPVIRQAARMYNLDEAYLRAVLMTESKGNINAVGPMTKYGHALGIAQFLPETAAEMGVKDPFNPYDAIPGAARYLRQGLDAATKFGADDPATYAALYYNGGPGYPGHAGNGMNYPETVAQYYPGEAKYLAANPAGGAVLPGTATGGATPGPGGPVPPDWAQPGARLGPGAWHPVGDSLAGGFVRIGKLPGVAVGKNAPPAQYNDADTADGRQPHQVLDYLKSLGDLEGTPIMLSTGISNNPKEAGLVPQMLAELKRANAGAIAVVGVGNKPGYEGGNYFDLRAYNPQLQQYVDAAKADGQDVAFMGGLPNTVVHPAPGYYGHALDQLGPPAVPPAGPAYDNKTAAPADTDKPPADTDKPPAQAGQVAPVDLPEVPVTDLPVPKFALGGG
jgi:hypothetical protein